MTLYASMMEKATFEVAGCLKPRALLIENPLGIEYII